MGFRLFGERSKMNDSDKDDPKNGVEDRRSGKDRRMGDDNILVGTDRRDGEDRRKKDAEPCSG